MSWDYDTMVAGCAITYNMLPDHVGRQTIADTQGLKRGVGLEESSMSGCMLLVIHLSLLKDLGLMLEGGVYDAAQVLP